MKLLAMLLSLSFAGSAFASWKSETKAVLKEYNYACKNTEVTIDSIVANEHIKGHITGLPTEAVETFKVYLGTDGVAFGDYLYAALAALEAGLPQDALLVLHMAEQKHPSCGPKNTAQIRSYRDKALTLLEKKTT